MATIRKRGNSWQVQIRTGKRAETASFQSKAKAVLWAVEKEAIHALPSSRSQPIRMADSITVFALLERYKQSITATKKGADQEAFKITVLCRDVIAGYSPWDLSGADISCYRERRLVSVKSGTVRRELAVLRHCLNIARREWGLPTLPDPFHAFRMPRHGNARVRRLSVEEQARLEHVLTLSRAKNLYALVRLALQTAMRRGELLALRWSNIDLASGVAFLPDTKNGLSRRVPLSPAAIQTLERMAITTDAVFSTNAAAISTAWSHAVRKAGITDFRFHDLRHEAISRFFEEGLSVPEVALISGHKDVRMLFRYTHLRAEDVAKKLATAITNREIH